MGGQLDLCALGATNLGRIDGQALEDFAAGGPVLQALELDRGKAAQAQALRGQGRVFQ